MVLPQTEFTLIPHHAKPQKVYCWNYFYIFLPFSQEVDIIQLKVSLVTFIVSFLIILPVNQHYVDQNQMTLLFFQTRLPSASRRYWKPNQVAMRPWRFLGLSTPRVTSRRLSISSRMMSRHGLSWLRSWNSPTYWYVLSHCFKGRLSSQSKSACGCTWNCDLSPSYFASTSTLDNRPQASSFGVGPVNFWLDKSCGLVFFNWILMKNNTSLFNILTNKIICSNDDFESDKIPFDSTE